MSERLAERGSALLMALILAAAVGAMALGFAHATRPEVAQTSRSIDTIRAAAILDAALAWTSQMIARERVVLGHEPAHLDWAFDGAVVEVDIRGESGLVDLNAASPQLIADLALYTGLNAADASAFKKALEARRRDPPSPPLGSGLRSMLRAGVAPKPETRFTHVARLRSVPEVGPETARLLEPLVSVYTGAAVPERELAPEPVVEVLKGQKAEAGAGSSIEIPHIGATANEDASAGNRRDSGSRRRDPKDLYRVTVSVRMQNGFRRVRQVVLSLADAGDRGYRVVDWSAPLVAHASLSEIR